MSPNVRVRDDLVLVIDDDPDIRIGLADLLSGYGYQALTESDAFQALELLAALLSLSGELPAVILCDVVMPGMDVVELKEELEREPLLANVPLIVMSGVERPRSLPPGVGGFLRKPVDRDHLLHVIRANVAMVGARTASFSN